MNILITYNIITSKHSMVEKKNSNQNTTQLITITFFNMKGNLIFYMYVDIHKM